VLSAYVSISVVYLIIITGSQLIKYLGNNVKNVLLPTALPPHDH